MSQELFQHLKLVPAAPKLKNCYPVSLPGSLVARIRRKMGFKEVCGEHLGTSFATHQLTELTTDHGKQ